MHNLGLILALGSCNPSLTLLRLGHKLCLGGEMKGTILASQPEVLLSFLFQYNQPDQCKSQLVQFKILDSKGKQKTKSSHTDAFGIIICQPGQHFPTTLYPQFKLTCLTLFWSRPKKKSKCLSTVLIGMHRRGTTSVRSCKEQSYQSCTHVPAFH